VCFAATIGLVTWIGARIAGIAAGLIAAVFLLVSLDYQGQALSGMESVFAAALGLAAIAFVLEERETWAAIFLVLAVRAVGARPIAIAAAAVVVVFVAGITDAGFGNAGTVVRGVADGHQSDGDEAFEATRRDAGLYIGRVAAPHDVIETCFGWIAQGRPTIRSRRRRRSPDPARPGRLRTHGPSKVCTIRVAPYAA
jgi:hypothetical protein